MNHQILLMDKEVVQEIRDVTLGILCGNVCNGAGSMVVDGYISNCMCLVEFTRRTRYVSAGIPEKYWEFTYDNLLPEFKDTNKEILQILKMYGIKLHEMVLAGHGLYIQGASGLAKSALSALTAKDAVSKGIVTYFTSMSQLTKLIMGANTSETDKLKLKWLVKRVKLLIVDEIDKDHNISNAQAYAGSHVNDFFRTMYEKKRTMIITSNVPRDELVKSNIQSGNLVDRFEELLPITITGKSFRQPPSANDLGLT